MWQRPLLPQLGISLQLLEDIIALGQYPKPYQQGTRWENEVKGDVK